MTDRPGTVLPILPPPITDLRGNLESRQQPVPSPDLHPPSRLHGRRSKSSWRKWLSAKRWNRMRTLPSAIRKCQKGEPLLPRLLTHTITFGCNAKCIMCDSWRLTTQGDLRTQEIEHIYAQLPSMDVVRITGGEPFIRRDMGAIVDFATHYLDPSLIYISSNGFLSDRIIRFCEERDRQYPLELALSIDGIGDFHDHIRGNSNAWRSVFQTLSALVPRQRQWNLRLIVNQTIANEAGIDQYYELHDLLAGLNVEHHVVIAYAESATYSLDRSRTIDLTNQGGMPTFAQFEASRLEPLLRDAAEHAKRLPWLRRMARHYYLRGMRDRILNRPERLKPTCQALHAHLRIFPNGDVPVCQFNSRMVGSFRTQTFGEIWNALRTEEERRWVRNCTGCWAECEVLPSALYTLDVLQANKFKADPTRPTAAGTSPADT